MSQLQCVNIAKKFNQEVVFKDFNYTFEHPNKYAILGENSSGKSTLIKIIGGLLMPSKGVVNHSFQTEISDSISYTSPDLELLEDYTVQEVFDFHYQFKKAKFHISEQLHIASLQKYRKKKYGQLSSGLKNKVKVSLALFSDTPILLLDEPCTNFDEKNVDWYQQMILRFCQKQLIIVGSNQLSEYNFCNHLINLKQFK